MIPFPFNFDFNFCFNFIIHEKLQIYCKNQRLQRMIKISFSNISYLSKAFLYRHAQKIEKSQIFVLFENEASY